MRGLVSWSRTCPRLGELPLASTCAITSKPVAGDRYLLCGRNSLFSLALSHGALIELAPVPAVLATQPLKRGA
jgi:hypothetical protein